MKSTFTKLTIILFLILGIAANTSHAQEVFRGDEESKPYTHLQFLNNPDNFQFAVVGDRTGGGRSGVFQGAVDVLNLLQPEFVMSVGDFIEGYEEEESALKSQWADVDEMLNPLGMPFFFVPGNHDVNLDPSEKVWFERVGANRSYSHFVYKNVLFLLMSTEDPPKNDPSPDLEDKYERVKSGKVENPEEAKKIIAELEHWAGTVNISDAQVEYFRNVLEANPKARWTFALMHSPPWAHQDPGNFTKIESLLADRPYTMFAGHTHTYDYTERNGRDYITMGMTGAAVPGSEIGHMDHVAWVTMTDEGPVISNVLLNGVLDKKGADPALQDVLLYQPRQITQ